MKMRPGGGGEGARARAAAGAAGEDSRRRVSRRRSRRWRPTPAIVVAYGKILPAALLAIPRHGFLNVHGSILPKYRGAAPIQRAIEHGETTTGVTIMRVDEELDHGPMLAIETTRDRSRRADAVACRAPLALGAEALLRVRSRDRCRSRDAAGSRRRDATRRRSRRAKARFDWSDTTRSRSTTSSARSIRGRAFSRRTS